MHILYMIFIAPLEWLMNTILHLSYDLTGNYGVSIIVLSIIVNIFLLPLYYMAEKWKAGDKLVQDSMKPEIDNIKKYYKGQERHFYIQAIYRRFSYHPLSSVKASVGFLIQIPFFFAAFHLLSNFEAFNGVSFGILQDLGAQDNLMAGINILPIVMTIVNLLSAYIYIELLSKSEKIQLIALAFIFLVVLYTEPAGLLLYWTMNNVFSLFKNLVEKKLKLKLKLGPLFSRVFKKKKITFDLIKNLCFKAVVNVLFVSLLLYGYLQLMIFMAPTGINNTFSRQLAENLIQFPVAALFLILFFIAFGTFIFNKINDSSITSLQKSKRSDFLLILLPLTAVFQYILLNQDILTVFGALYILIAVSAISIVLVISIPVLLSGLASRVIMMSLGLSLLTLFIYMPQIATYFSWSGEGTPRYILIIFVSIFFSVLVLYRTNHKFLKVLICIMFLGGIFNTVLNDKGKTILFETNLSSNLIASEQERPIITEILKKEFQTKPDIFLLIYDAYPNSKMMNNYGIDNSKQEKYLKNKGFNIYNEIYSIGGSSLESLTTMLNMNDIMSSQEVAKEMMSGNTQVYKILKNQGYKVAVMLPDNYMFGKNVPTVELFYPKQSFNHKKMILQSIAKGEFTSDADKEFTDADPAIFNRQKMDFFASKQHPKFIYTHIGPGHSPNDKRCRPGGEIHHFKNRLKTANDQMKKDIDSITENNPNAIIIVAGDHGPYLIGNCLMANGFSSANEVHRKNLQDSFGMFLSIKWPKSFKNPVDNDITVLQDVFPSILATILEDKKIFNPLKVKPVTIDVFNANAGVIIDNGIIKGGPDDGKKLFLNKNVN